MKTLTNAEDAASLLARIGTVTSDSPRRWGDMTAHQMICHLSDSFLVGLGEIEVSSAVDFLKKNVIKWIALYGPFQWPQGVPTRPEIDQQAGGGTPPAEFQRDVEKFSSLLRRFANNTDFKVEHPIFGPMSTSEWQRWGYLHVDHHLRQFGA
jgi:hypothetical protein